MAGPPFSSLFAPIAKKILDVAPTRQGEGLLSLARLPLGLFAETLATSASLVLNHLIAQQRTTSEKLAREAGKVVVFQVAPVRIGLRVTSEGYFQTSRQTGNVVAPADTEITMQWSDLAGSLSAPSSVARKARIQGDMDFAQTVSSAIMDLHWDAEHDLSRIVGDAQAVWIMNSLNTFGLSLKDLFNRFKSSLREYAVFEKGMAPTADEFESFRSGVSNLRDDLARLEKRLAKMESQSNPTGRDSRA